MKKVMQLSLWDYAPTKKCSRCGEYKPENASFFYQIKQRGTWYAQCRACQKDKRQDPEFKEKKSSWGRDYEAQSDVKERRRIQRNTPDRRARRGEYRKEYRGREYVKEKNREYSREYSLRPGVSERRREYRKLPYVKKRQAAHLKTYRKIRMKNDPAFATIARLRTNLCDAIFRYGISKKSKSSRKYGIDYKKIIEHIGPVPAAGYQVDHVFPCSAFDHSRDIEVSACWSEINMQWLSSERNYSKRANNCPALTLAYKVAFFSGDLIKAKTLVDVARQEEAFFQGCSNETR